MESNFSGRYVLVCILFVKVSCWGRWIRSQMSGIHSSHTQSISFQFSNLLFFFQAKGESSKNHKHDSENLGKSGIIPVKKDKYGYNPGELMVLYLEVLNPKNDRLFQRPQRTNAKWFDIHDFKINTLFENKPIGKNMVGEMLKKLLKAADQPQNWTNHTLRSTGITSLVASGIQDREITNLSGTLVSIFEIDFSNG